MKNFFYGWWIVIALFFIGFYVSGVAFYGFTAFFEPLIREFGWSYTQVSFAASLRGMEMGIFAPIMGFFVDRLGPKRVVLFGVVAVGLGLISLSFANSLAMFYGGFLLLTFGAGGCTVLVGMSAVANWFQKDIGKALGIMASGFGASGFMVPVIVGMIDAWDWRATYLILGFGAFLVGIPLSFVIRNRPEPYGYTPDGRPQEEKAQPVQRSAEKIRFTEIIRNRAFIFLNLTEFIRLMAVSAVVVHVMPYLSLHGITRTRSSLIAAAIPVCSVIGRVGFGWLGDVCQKRSVMALSYGLMGLGMIAFSHAQVQWLILLFLLSFPPSYGGATVLRGAMLREYYGRDSFGKSLGIVLGSSSVGGIIGPTLAGWVFDTSGTYRFVWYPFSVLLLFTIFLVFQIKRYPTEEIWRAT
jgi:sugar phosphate permease